MRFQRLKAATAGLMLAANFTAVTSMPVYAQSSSQVTTTDQTVDMLRYANELHLGYIRSSNAQQNDNVHRGLSELSAALITNTSVEPRGVVGLDVENDPLMFFPFIYWQVDSNTAPLSPAAQVKVQDYLNNGGVILFDVRDQSVGLAQSTALQNILGGLAIDPLVRVEQGHTLTHTHYLLSQMRGSGNGQNIWVEAPVTQSEGHVSSVIISQENWVSAWRGLTHLRGSEGHTQAIRAGINMVLYALTGDYKDDPIHRPTLEYKNTPR